MKTETLSVVVGALILMNEGQDEIKVINRILGSINKEITGAFASKG